MKGSNGYLDVVSMTLKSDVNPLVYATLKILNLTWMHVMMEKYSVLMMNPVVDLLLVPPFLCH